MPGTAEVTPSVLVTDRSAWGVSVSVSVAAVVGRVGVGHPGGRGDRGGVVRRAGGRRADLDREGEGDVAPTGRSTVVARAPRAAGRAGDAAAAGGAGDRPGGAGDAGRQRVGDAGPGDGAGAVCC